MNQQEGIFLLCIFQMGNAFQSRKQKKQPFGTLMVEHGMPSGYRGLPPALNILHHYG